MEVEYKEGTNWKRATARNLKKEAKSKVSLRITLKITRFEGYL